jgi:hypothetical protein
MERSPICATCLSKYPDIRGLVYFPGQVVGTQCPDAWHRGADYDPDKWVLSAFDEEFLTEQKVSSR